MKIDMKISQYIKIKQIKIRRLQLNSKDADVVTVKNNISDNRN